ncbi:MAG: trigger factor [Pseudomonadota bacterium]|nr:trigger factor [Pseudomonadota bacterium]
MSHQVDQISAFQKRLQFSVPSTEVDKKISEAFRVLSGRVNIPGFRRGKVPRKVLDQRYGRQIRSDVASDLINTEFRQAALDIEFLGQPEVDRSDLLDGADFNFSITVQVKPAVEVKDYTGIKVDFPVPTVTEDQVDLLVSRRLQGQSRLVEVEGDRVVARGDLALTEIVLIEDGTEKTIESGTMVNTAGDRYYTGAETLLIGLAKGESKTGTVTIAANAGMDSLRGRTVELKVTVLGIQVSQVPELTDAVATELGYEGGVEAMRSALRMEEEGRATEASRNVARVNLLQKLIGTHSFDVPPAMVDSHLQLLLEELRIQAAYRGRDPRSIRYSEAQMADLRQRASFAARASLLLEGVAKAEGIEITNEDLEAKYQEIADMRGQRVEAIRGYFAKDNAIGELQKRLLEERTLDWLLERAELVDVTGTDNDSAPAMEPFETETPAIEAAPAAEVAEEAPKAAKAKAAPKAKAPKAEAAAAEGAEVAAEAAPAKPKAKSKAKKTEE